MKCRLVIWGCVLVFYYFGMHVLLCYPLKVMDKFVFTLELILLEGPFYRQQISISDQLEMKRRRWIWSVLSTDLHLDFTFVIKYNVIIYHNNSNIMQYYTIRYHRQHEFIFITHI